MRVSEGETYDCVTRAAHPGNRWCNVLDFTCMTSIGGTHSSRNVALEAMHFVVSGHRSCHDV